MKIPVPALFSLLLILINTGAIAQNRVVVIPMGGEKGTVAKTGQTVCYDPECYCYPDPGTPTCYVGFSCPQVPCEGTGQDGELRKGYAVTSRFTDNGNGTATDRLTGLIWLKKGDCAEFFDGDLNGQNARPWRAALEAANMLSSGYCGLNDGSQAGEWRLPNIRELVSLIDYGQTDPALPPGHPFTGIASDWYWTSTTHSGGSEVGLRVDLLYGGDGNYYKSNSHKVLAVRGGR